LACEIFALTSIFNMPRKPSSHFGVSPKPAPLRRFALRLVLLFLVRPFEGAAEERPLADGLEQIAGTLRAVGVLPEDSIVKQIGSEFRLLFCGAAPAAKMKSQPGDSLIDPVKSISDLLREPPRSSAAAAAVRRFIALCKRAILSRLRRSFL
jgi:hypothetical protein